MTWQRGISDAGVSNLRFCERLERVNLMGSPTGNGAIEALQGKAHLSYFSSGRLVTDEGIPVLHNFPLLKHAGRRPPPIDAESTGAGTHLLIDGPITDAGLAGLAGLDGLVELDLFWHVTAVTPDGFAHLRRLPNLQVLGADGELSGDAAMRHIAAIPHLRRLRAQGTAATDEGFEALSRSNTLESLWGRECPHLGSRGFIALSRMPTLRALGVSCKNVGEDALSCCRRFPPCASSRPSTSPTMGSGTSGNALDSIGSTCMYCRETTDLATEHVAGLALKYLLRGSDEDYRPQPGDSRSDDVTRTGGLV